MAVLQEPSRAVQGGMVDSIIVSLDASDSTKFESIIDSIEKSLRDKDVDRLQRIAVLERLTIINSELLHLWQKGPADRIAEIAEARKNERELVASTLVQLKKDLIDFDQDVRDADHEHSVLAGENEQLQAEITNERMQIASVEKELSENTASRVQANIQLQEQKAALQAYKQKVNEVNWERQDVEEETELKAQLARAETQRLQSMAQAEHKNREQAAMQFNDVRAAVGRSNRLLKELRVRHRNAAATVAALATECDELTGIDNSFDDDFEHVASREIHRLLQEAIVAEAALKTDKIETERHVTESDREVRSIREQVIPEKLKQEQVDLQREQSLAIERRTAEEITAEAQRTVDGLEAQAVLAKKEIADMTAQLLDMESGCADIEDKLATQQEAFNAIANAKKEATATLHRNAETLERIVAAKERTLAELQATLEQRRSEASKLLEQEHGTAASLQATAQQLKEQVEATKQKTEDGINSYNESADAEAAAIKQLTALKRERQEFVARRDEILARLEQRKPVAKREAEHTEREIMRFQQTLVEAERAREDAAAAMRQAVDDLQFAQDQLMNAKNDCETRERVRDDEAELLHKASAKLRAATEEIKRERAIVQLEYDAVKTRDFLARALNFRLVRALRRTEKQTRDIVAMVRPVRDATVVAQQMLVKTKAETKATAQTIRNDHKSFVASLRVLKERKSKQAQLLRDQSNDLQRVHRSLAVRIDSIDDTLRSIPTA
eukprot:m.934460 g.934460  ORF g.934460 m.934460 type:complete len:732 (-) comp23798_c2_seq19:1261-3456(-)